MYYFFLLNQVPPIETLPYCNRRPDISRNKEKERSENEHCQKDNSCGQWNREKERETHTHTV